MIQKAIAFTRSIGLEYIWIDAFCIVQASKDDDGDWRTEASKMAAYYSNALITISASSAASTEEGIYTPREGWYAPRVVEIIDSDDRRKKILVQERPYDQLAELDRLELVTNLRTRLDISRERIGESHDPFHFSNSHVGVQATLDHRDRLPSITRGECNVQKHGSHSIASKLYFRRRGARYLAKLRVLV